MTPTTLQVYFVRPVGMRGPIKIGCSKLPENRIKSLMVWSPFELEIAVAIPGNFKLEKAIHEVRVSTRRLRAARSGFGAAGSSSDSANRASR